MAIKITGQSVFMDFEHVAETDKIANKFIKTMMKINRELTLEQNPKPDNTRSRFRSRWKNWNIGPKQNPKLDTWRTDNKQYRLTISIERI